MPRARWAVATGLALSALVLAGCGGDDASDATDTGTVTTIPAGTALAGSVGPGFDISLATADGEEVSTLAPGEYTIDVNDQADIHNFHLTGPGVDEDSGVSEMGMSSWTVTFEPGTYEFVCDPHAGSMNGSFEVVG